MPNSEDLNKKKAAQKLVQEIGTAFFRTHPELNTIFAHDQLAQMVNSHAKNYSGTAIAFAVDYILEEIERKGGIEHIVK